MRPMPVAEPGAVTTRVLTGDALAAALPDLARLRIEVFRDWPYLYDGDLEYEARYLQRYRDSAGAIVVGAYDGETLVGAATGTPMEDHAGDFASAFHGSGLRLEEIFYCAESVLLPGYRGQGVGRAFFAAREAHAVRLGRRRMAFCAVVRPNAHPARPEGYRSLDGFWRRLGYRPLAGAIAGFDWRDIGAAGPSEKPLQVWIKVLEI